MKAIRASELIKELKMKMERWGDVEVYHDQTLEKIEYLAGYPGVNGSEPFITIE